MKGGKLSVTTGSALTKAREAADADADDQRRDDEHRAVKVHRIREARHHDARELDQRADGKIDAGRDDHEGLTDREDRVIRDLTQHVREVAGRERIAVRENALIAKTTTTSARSRRPHASSPGATSIRLRVPARRLGARPVDFLGMAAARSWGSPSRSRGDLRPRGAITLSRALRRRARIRRECVPSRTTSTRCDIPSTSGSSLDTMTIAAPRASSATISA